MTTDVADLDEPSPAADPTAGDVPRGSRLDDWWGRVLAVGWRFSAWRWGGPIAVTLAEGEGLQGHAEAARMRLQKA